MNLSIEAGRAKEKKKNIFRESVKPLAEIPSLIHSSSLPPTPSYY